MLPRTVVYDPELTVLAARGHHRGERHERARPRAGGGVRPRRHAAAGRPGRGGPARPGDGPAGCRRRRWRPRRPGRRRCTARGSPAGRSAAPRWGCTTSSPTSWAAPTGCRTPASTARCCRRWPRSTHPPCRRPSPRAARALGVDGPSVVARALFDLAERLGAPTSLAALGLRADAVDDVAAAVAAADVPNPRAFDAADLRRLLGDALRRPPPTDRRRADRIPPRRSMMTDTTPDLAALEARARTGSATQHLRPAGTGRRPRPAACTTRR